MVNANMLCHLHLKKKKNWLLAIVTLESHKSSTWHKMPKHLQEFLYKAAFLSKAPFLVKTFNNCTRQNFVRPLET